MSPSSSAAFEVEGTEKQAGIDDLKDLATVASCCGSDAIRTVGGWVLGSPLRF